MKSSTINPLLNKAILCISALASVICSADLALNNGQKIDSVDRVVLKVHGSRPYESAHDEAVIQLAMKVTEAEFGAFTIDIDRRGRSAARTFKELGKTVEKMGLNTFVAVTNPEREKTTLAIKIPIRMGLLNYRVIVAQPQTLNQFTKINDLESLTSLRLGSLRQWSVTPILEHNKFNVVKNLRSNNIYKLLHAGRYDYLLRGVSEVFNEIGPNNKNARGAVMEPRLLVYIPTPYYVFVAPRNPRLRQRIEIGLEKAIEDGRFKKLFLKYFEDRIRQADINERTVLYVSNPQMKNNPALLRPELWYIADQNIEKHLRSNY